MIIWLKVLKIKSILSVRALTIFKNFERPVKNIKYIDVLPSLKTITNSDSLS
jgi:hypothetical protein